MNFLSALLPKPKEKKMASWRLKEQIVAHGVTKEKFGPCGGVLCTHFWHNWQWLHQIEMAIRTIQQIQWSQPLQAGRWRAQGEFSLIFVGASFQSAKHTTDIGLGKQTSYCTPSATARVLPALDMDGQRGCIPTKEHLCVHCSPPQSYLLWSKGICVKMRGIYTEFHFFLFALSFLSFASHFYMMRALMAQQLQFILHKQFLQQCVLSFYIQVGQTSTKH